jgi:hypothetical protein
LLAAAKAFIVRRMHTHQAIELLSASLTLAGLLLRGRAR